MTRVFETARHLAAQAQIEWSRWRVLLAPILPL